MSTESAVDKLGPDALPPLHTVAQPTFLQIAKGSRTTRCCLRSIIHVYMQTGVTQYTTTAPNCSPHALARGRHTHAHPCQ